MNAIPNQIFIKSTLRLIIALFILVRCSSPTILYEVGHIQTNYGEMLFWLYDQTPAHKKSFIELAQNQYWDTLSFNRIIKDFVIQGGCPDTPAGFSDSPYLIPPEFNQDIRHIYGALGAGRDENPEKRSAGCQLYIVNNAHGIPRLDDNYVIFGQIFKGYDVLEAIANVPTEATDRPLDLITMKVATIKMTKEELIAHGFNFDKDDH